MDDIIIDGMKKESRLARNVIIFDLILFLLTLVDMFVNNKSLQDELIFLIVYFIFFVFAFYLWLYAIKYSLKITTEKIFLKTLFRKIEINICSIEKYTCNRYMKSEFYQFNLFIKDKRIFINTRYKEEFECLLKDYKIEQINK